MIIVGLSYIIAHEFFDALPIHQFQVDSNCTYIIDKYLCTQIIVEIGKQMERGINWSK